jgi:hypothetical protein
MDSKKFRVAAVQSGPVLRDAPNWFDVPATLESGWGKLLLLSQRKREEGMAGGILKLKLLPLLKAD